MNTSVGIVLAAIASFVSGSARSCEFPKTRHALFVGRTDGEGTLARLDDALVQPHQVELDRTAKGDDLEFDMRRWANNVRNSERIDWAMLYVQADLILRDEAWQLTADFDGLGKPTNLPLTNAIKRLVQATSGAPGLLIVQTTKSDARVQDLSAALNAAKAKGPLTVIVIQGDQAGRAVARYLGGGEISTKRGWRSFTTGDLIGALERRPANQVVTASSGDNPFETVLVTHGPRLLDEMLTALGQEVDDSLSKPALLVVPDANSPSESFPLLQRITGVGLRAALTGSSHRVLAAEEIRRRHSAAATCKLAEDSVLVQLQLSPGENASEMRVRCELLPPLPNGRILDGLAVRTPTHWGLKGQSVVTKGGAGAVKLPSATNETPTVSTIDFAQPKDVASVVAETLDLEKRSLQQLHPLVDSRFPYRAELLVNGASAPVRFSPDRKRQYVQLKKNESYTIRIKNLSDQPVFLRLLVDGLNTLPDRPLVAQQHEGDTILEVAVKDPASALVPAPYALLHNARSWFCENRGIYEVRGFFTNIGAVGERAEFVVTDASLAEASERGYSKDLGIVTAAVFSAVDGPTVKGGGARYGTKLGKVATEKVELYTDTLVPGDLLAVIHLHYGFDTP